MLVPVLQAGAAEVDWQERAQIRLEETPLDIKATPDGKRIFVLSPGGEVQILDPAGKLLAELPAGEDVDGLEVLANGDRLLLKSSSGKTLRLVDLTFVQSFDLADSPSLGPEEAEVTVVVFDDFECPYCARLAPTLKQVQERFPDSVRVVFKNYPLRMHKLARPAALAALAAQRQGKFWEYHDLLFANYNQLSEEKLSAFAKQLGLDAARFAKDRKDPALNALLARDARDAAEAGVRGTPTVFVNGRLLKDRGIQGFAKAIEAARAMRTVEKQNQRNPNSPNAGT